MNSEALARFWDCFDALPSEIRKQAREAFAVWRRDVGHPGLQFKRVHPSKPLFSVRIGDRWCALGYRRDDTMIRFWIGSHGDYDKIIRRY